MSFTIGQAYEIKVPMQVYWDSAEARAQNDTHNSSILQPSTVYISNAYSESLLPAIPIRSEPYPSGYDIGWLNISENALPVVPVWVGTSSGNQQAKEIWVGTSSGNQQAKEIWVGTSSGNKQIF